MALPSLYDDMLIPEAQGYSNFWNRFPSKIEPYALTWKTTQTEEHDMTKINRNLYIFAVVSKADVINIEYLVAESDQQARDEIVRERLPEGAKVKDFEIKLLRIEALKPRTENE